MESWFFNCFKRFNWLLLSLPQRAGISLFTPKTNSFERPEWHKMELLMTEFNFNWANNKDISNNSVETDKYHWWLEDTFQIEWIICHRLISFLVYILIMLGFCLSMDLHLAQICWMYCRQLPETIRNFWVLKKIGSVLPVASFECEHAFRKQTY